MKTLFYLVLTASLLAGLSNNAYAYNSYNETYGVMGCKSYLQGKEQYRGWLIGYLTALEKQTGANVLQGRNQQQVFNLFDRYCRANPISNMDEAANYVFSSLGGR